MKFPSCDDQKLDERFSHGIEVDICPKCSGVWLDRGELEKLAGSTAEQRSIDTDDLTLLVSGAHDDVQDGATASSTRDGHDGRNHDDDDDDDDDDEERPSGKKREESRWEELADILEDLFEDIFDFD